MSFATIDARLAALRAELRARANGLLPGHPPGDHTLTAPHTDVERLAALVSEMHATARNRPVGAGAFLLRIVFTLAVGWTLYQHAVALRDLSQAAADHAAAPPPACVHP